MEWEIHGRLLVRLITLGINCNLSNNIEQIINLRCFNFPGVGSFKKGVLI